MTIGSTYMYWTPIQLPPQPSDSVSDDSWAAIPVNPTQQLPKPVTTVPAKCSTPAPTYGYDLEEEPPLKKPTLIQEIPKYNYPTTDVDRKVVELNAAMTEVFDLVRTVMEEHYKPSKELKKNYFKQRYCPRKREVSKVNITVISFSTWSSWGPSFSEAPSRRSRHSSNDDSGAFIVRLLVGLVAVIVAVAVVVLIAKDVKRNERTTQAMNALNNLEDKINELEQLNPKLDTAKPRKLLQAGDLIFDKLKHDFRWSIITKGALLVGAAGVAIAVAVAAWPVVVAFAAVAVVSLIVIAGRIAYTWNDDKDLSNIAKKVLDPFFNGTELLPSTL